MELGDIAKKYSENLKAFFANSRVIDIIGEEQYGKESYQGQKAECTQRYNDIMTNTVFIPYITLEHLEKFIVFIKLKYGKEEAETKFPKEIKLLNILTNVKQGIVLDYTTRLIEEVKSILPNHDGVEVLLEKCLEDKTSEIPNNMILFFKTNKVSKFQQARVCRCIQNYRRQVKEIILLETSSFSGDRKDDLNDKNYRNVLSKMSRSETFVIQQVGNQSKREIYLPVLEYRAENEYLENAMHEVMHITKEESADNTYRTGLLERKKSNNQDGELIVYYNKIENVLENAMWKKLIKGKQIPESNQKYHAYMGTVIFEEVTHHWQVKNAVRKAVESKILEENPLYMLNKEEISVCRSVYEKANGIMERFMSKFEGELQKINNRRTTIKGFRRTVGSKNFRLLARLCTEVVNAKKVAPEYINIADDIINDMEQRKQNRQNILDRTKGIRPQRIGKMADTLSDMRIRYAEER